MKACLLDVYKEKLLDAAAFNKQAKAVHEEKTDGLTIFVFFLSAMFLPGRAHRK